MLEPPHGPSPDQLLIIGFFSGICVVLISFFGGFYGPLLIVVVLAVFAIRAYGSGRL